MLRDKIVTLPTLLESLESQRAKGRKVVFTNGCFDLLHAGHVLYLEEARALGDILVLGLNSDSSVQRLKGPSRPINKQDERAMVLAALESISYVCIFEEDTPYELIKALQPDILVKGGDWPVSSIVGSDIVLARGGQVKSLGFSEGLSSTNIIQSILRDGK
ncbi:MAG TPA: D-glycero-beta-D-manno-heptose 1-phosphate adenylyltransferase [Candidatus Cloacimonadota bacterium]|jgi:D-beta-D-heptose 7-phosphate kinase/D-beta-D-heptose 1-phosphate adenosyltransferase|nr:D-glycero-beta-D-manno-heptose 1-phosphate adenylyltransferase [Candidatus Cloacimonadota bacterium]MDD4100753.1 D-glycero-beta-D-manno-heptose 1-phosphate adenylyltransferase [Candidatus Cloacimonadota bacterium]MDD4806253.1 D-glycero-beta-D-manno-heptose 1-phosphate adenylyltransferase [Candidatus Cloacimonadota bacterium]NCB32252.1 D-glycero-beta-D-manno-heptose 1-phosphate adenylyltransferase [Clostridia bacterium]HOA29422.1 D-glycero-beta-D-manno-heptose 1-phosphate adenylyltransferase 